MKMKKSVSSLLFCFLFTPVFALGNSGSGSGGDCGGDPPEYDLEKHKNSIAIVGGHLYRYLEDHVHRAAIVSRAGSDQSSRKFKNPSKQNTPMQALPGKTPTVFGISSMFSIFVEVPLPRFLISPLPSSLMTTPTSMIFTLVFLQKIYRRK